MNITRRKATDQDAGFLLDLFKAVRGPEFAIAGLPPAQLDMLLNMQFQAQTSSYRAQFPDADHQIVLVDGATAGRTLVDRSSEQLVLVDISILPAYQKGGVGSALVGELIAEARAAGLPVRCSVGVSNPGSLRFHQRLGFRVVSQDPVYCELECAP